MCVVCVFVSTSKEIKEIRTQLSMVAYLFANPKQYGNPLTSLPPPFRCPQRPNDPPNHRLTNPPPHPKCFPQRQRLLDCWVLGNILCKLQVKCENSSDWFNSAMPTKCRETRKMTESGAKKKTGKTAETAENQQSWEFGILK